VRGLNRFAASAVLGFWMTTHAGAQESTQDRMRDALRQAVTEMRAAQDQAAQAQADAQKAQADKSALQAQLDAANAKLADLQGKGIKPADLAAMQGQMKALAAQADNLQQLNAKLQASLQGATDLARAKDEESREAEAGLKANTAALQTCKAANAKLITVSQDILHLYETQSFRSLLVRSYEPIIGTARVRLENLVQTYDDKIHDQEYVAPAPPRTAK
jgi:TolA-binding protein